MAESQASPAAAPLMAIPRQTGDLIISIEYDPSSAHAWCDMWDNEVLGWIIDPSGVAQPLPSVVGSLPPVRTGADPVKCPQWVHFRGIAVIVPNLWRGHVADFFTWLATGSGAQRQLRGAFLDHVPLNSFLAWAARNPTLVWPGP